MAEVGIILKKVVLAMPSRLGEVAKCLGEGWATAIDQAGFLSGLKGKRELLPMACDVDSEEERRWNDVINGQREKRGPSVSAKESRSASLGILVGRAV